MYLFYLNYVFLVAFTRQPIYKTIITPRQSSTKVQPIEALNKESHNSCCTFSVWEYKPGKLTLIGLLCFMHVLPPLTPFGSATA